MSKQLFRLYFSCFHWIFEIVYQHVFMSYISQSKGILLYSVIKLI